MFIGKLVDKLPIKNDFAILNLAGFPVPAVIPSISGAIAAVIYAATRKKKG